MIRHSAFCNKSARLLPRLLLMVRAYKAAGADLVFASAETFSSQYSQDWLRTGDAPNLFFVRYGTATPEPLGGKLTVAAAISFINSKLANTEHRIPVPREEPEVISDPVPAKNDGPVKQVVADTFGELVLNSQKVGENN